jgi:alpha-L-rhamnosidase
MLPAPSPLPIPANTLNLTPASWIWYPSERTLANTFILFRKELSLPSPPRSITGWITADSRYELRLNGNRIQFGPAPCDPRWLDVDGVEIGKENARVQSAIVSDANGNCTIVLGAIALFYGHGDGTSPIGKPGFICLIDLTLEDGTKMRVVSDATWQAHLARCWRPGQYKRWYLRSLQEEFDARLYPHGWEAPGFKPDESWTNAMVLSCPPDKPPVCSTYTDYAFDTHGDTENSWLRRRSIPPLKETAVSVKALMEAYSISWKRPADEYFDVLPPDSFTASPETTVVSPSAGEWTVQPKPGASSALTFAFEEQIVGFPYFTIDAPAGTIVELLVQEGHTPGKSPLLNTHFHAWARFICKEGKNHFQAFDYESLRWLQLHIRNTTSSVRVSNVGVLRRLFPWKRFPSISVAEPPLQRLISASVNTLLNSAQETAVDGMGRERQQYSGDGGHQLHAVHLAMGEPRIPARFVATFSQGLTLEGFFLDCWPAFDRLSRLSQRQIGLTIWGPLLDHGVGFVFDCYYHWLYTADLEALREPYPRLQRFIRYLASIQTSDGLLPVTDIGTPAVWMDHVAYVANHQHHKQCAFNLYAAAMLLHAFTPLANAMEDTSWASAATRMGKQILRATVKSFWSKQDRTFVVNLPWIEKEQTPRMCDRSLATAILFDQCPNGDVENVVRTLVDVPPTMGLSYPANAAWRLWALSKMGRTDVVLRDLRDRWATMDSVRLNNAIGENWQALPDGPDLWSHCAVVPLYIMYMGIAGITPLEPGFARVRIRPQPATLEHLELVVPSVRGEIGFRSGGVCGDRTIAIRIPEACKAEIVLPAADTVALKRRGRSPVPGSMLYDLPSGKETVLNLKQT